LDFFIAYFLEYYVSNQGNEEFIIYSKNKDYDPFIEYLQNKNINVKIIVNFEQMNENTKNSFKKNPFKYISTLWSKLALSRKICFSAIIIAVIVGIIAISSLLSSPMVLVLDAPIFDAPITDKAVLDRILFRLKEAGVSVKVTPDGIVRVADRTTARRMKAILISEDIIPAKIDPWTITDLERNVNLQRAQRRMITEHLKAIDGVDDVSVNILWPRKTLFTTEQNPVTASVVIFPTPGSDITQNRKKIKSIQKILKLAIEGLEDENIVIVDQFGLVLNDFEGVTE
jgi:flagellar M-ring protein FliF